MKILYTDQGEILYAVTEADFPHFTHSTQVPLTVATLDDDDETIRQVRSFIFHNHCKRDAKGEAPCYVDTKTNTLVIRETWVEQPAVIAIIPDSNGEPS